MKTFPIMLKTADKPVVVVGSGTVGIRKTEMLAEAGAAVRLVGRCESTTLEQLPDNVELHQQDYSPDALTGAMLVFACTDNRQLNKQIVIDAHRLGALVNVADQPDDCDFFMPAIHRNGPVVLAVGTGSAAPSLAASLRDRLADTLPKGIGNFAETLEQARRTIRKRVSRIEHRAAVMKRLAKTETMKLFADEGAQAVLELAETLINELEA